MNRGRRGERTFPGDADFEDSVDLLRAAPEIFHIGGAACCLMSNHFDLLVSRLKTIIPPSGKEQPMNPEALRSNSPDRFAVIRFLAP